MSGYDIKSHVDISTSFFFSASYSQIYPELKRLEQKGLVEGTELATGRRSRTEYAITGAGREAFANWQAEPSSEFDLRDEGILKLFFGGGLDQQQLLDKLTAMRDARETELARIRAVGDDMPEIADELQHAVLDFGIEFYEFVIGWIDRTAEQLAARPPNDFPVNPTTTG